MFNLTPANCTSFLNVRSLVVVCLQIAEGGNGDREFEDRFLDREFEDRFLRAFGLMDSVASVKEREQKLKRQSQTSPW